MTVTITYFNDYKDTFENVTNVVISNGAYGFDYVSNDKVVCIKGILNDTKDIVIE